jgi:hypothetical protein
MKRLKTLVNKFISFSAFIEKERINSMIFSGKGFM